MRALTLLSLLSLLAATALTGAPASAQGATDSPYGYRASHVLIPWKGATRAPADVTRTREEAQALAKKVLAGIQGGGDLAALAKKHSSCPSAERGGDLGTFQRGQMIPEFEKAVRGAKIGEVVGPVETAFGYHVIRRESDPPPPMAASHILIPWKGAMRAPADVQRSKEDALKLANEVFAKVKETDADFGKLAQEHSSCPSKARGGDLGTFSAGQMIAEFEKACAAAGVGEVVGPVETAFGYHIIRRNPDPPAPMGAAHILIPWKGATRAPSDVTRTKEDALKLTNELLAKLKEAGTDFGALAKQHSSCPSSQQGGNLGTFRPGQMVPAFEKACAAAKIGEIVGPVETPFGYHLIKRTN